MKIENNKKKIIIVAVATIFVCTATAVFAYNQPRSEDPQPVQTTQVNTQQQTTDEEERSAGNQAKSDSANQAASPSPTPQTVTMQISASSQNGSTYQLRILINAILSGGTCNLTLTKGSDTVTKSANIQSLAQSSTCQGFDIPTSELSPGTWQVKVTLQSAGVNGSTSDAIEVK